MLRRDGYGARKMRAGAPGGRARPGEGSERAGAAGRGCPAGGAVGSGGGDALSPLSSAESGARRRGARRPRNPEPAAGMGPSGGCGLQVDTVPCGVSVTPGVFSTTGRRSVCRCVLENDQIRGVVCLNYHGMYENVIAEIIQ